MRVRIQNFRAHKDLDLEFKSGSLVLLNGHSGSGKSTILQAIYWCLYGSMNHIYPRGSSKNRTVVELQFSEMGGLIVKRSKPPSHLEVIVGNQTLPSIEAQEYIYGIFGSKNLFFASSYLAQSSRSPLTSLPSSEKFNLLYELTFGDSEEKSLPEHYISEVDSKISKNKESLTRINGSYDQLVVNYKADHSNNLEAIKRWSQRSLEQIKSLKDECELKISALRKDMDRVRGLEIKHSLLQKERETLTKEINEIVIEPSNENQIREIESRILVHKEVETLKILKEKLSNYERIILDSHKRSGFDQNQELKFLHNQGRIYQEYINLNIQPGDDSHEKLVKEISLIEDSIASHRNWRQKQEKYNSYLSMKSMVSQLIQVNKNQKQEYESRIKRHAKIKEDEEKHLIKKEAFQKHKDAIVNLLGNSFSADMIKRELANLGNLQCPNCEHPLIWKNGILSKNFNKDELDRRRNVLQSALEHANRIRELNFVEKRFEYPSLEEPIYREIPNIGDEVKKPQPFNGKIYTQSELERLKVKAQKIASLETPTLTMDEVTAGIKSCMNMEAYKKLILKIESYKNLQIPATTLDEDQKILSVLRAEKDRNHKLQTRLDILKSKLIAIDEEKIQLPNPTSNQIQLEIERFEKERQTLIIDLEDGKTYHRISGSFKQIAALTAKKVEYETYGSSLEKIKKCINRIATESMSGLVEMINHTLNSVASEIFDDDITLLLKTQRALKSRDIVRLEVNLEIMHKGSVYNKPSFLSGGEQDRLSLALTIALCKINTSPILLLDECMASINEELRERCIEMLRIHVPHKTIIHVCHEIVKGSHDYVIPIGCC